MSTVDNDYRIMEEGISALLGKESYGEPELMPPPCKHISDGFVYEDNPVFTTLQCVRCGIQYDMLKATGMIM